jgi:mono/diheme cytochrome c family protein
VSGFVDSPPIIRGANHATQIYGGRFGAWRSVFLLSANAQVFSEYSGEETFTRFCASCHGSSGQGDGPVAAGIPITVPNLTTLRKRQGDHFPEETLRKIIDGRNIVVYHGTRYMPVWGYEFWIEEGADEEAEKKVTIIIRNLISYIESIQK